MDRSGSSPGEGLCYRAGMQLLRIRHVGDDYYGALVDDRTARLWTAAPWLGGEQTDRFVPLKPGALLAPVEPSKIVCVGRNYRSHAAELGNEVPEEPLLFLKPPSALLGPEGEICLPRQSERVEHEGEVGVVIGQPLRDANAEQAREGIFGVTCVNDVTARDLQRKDGQFTRAKGFDTFCPCGPWVSTDADPRELTLELRVNGETRQRGQTRDMIWPIAELLAYISSVMTLHPGDLVCTGTPEGVGPLVQGDQVELELGGIGLLGNRVTARGG
jgi:2-keto-4-pentenoate hydratase/2-oxohepta-3-ene-1,7-dioic acid hydratase in catechol pathway